MIDENTGRPFNPSPAAFLGGVDIYDREETLGEILNSYDIHKCDDRRKVIENHCVGYLRNLSYRKKYFIWQALKISIESGSYDFAKLLEHDPEECSALPDFWDEMEDPTQFFSEIFEVATAAWREDISKAELELPATWISSK